jgi:hypothetical protein
MRIPGETPALRRRLLPVPEPDRVNAKAAPERPRELAKPARICSWQAVGQRLLLLGPRGCCGFVPVLKTVVEDANDVAGLAVTPSDTGALGRRVDPSQASINSLNEDATFRECCRLPKTIDVSPGKRPERQVLTSLSPSDVS